MNYGIKEVVKPGQGPDRSLTATGPNDDPRCRLRFRPGFIDHTMEVSLICAEYSLAGKKCRDSDSRLYHADVHVPSTNTPNFLALSLA